MIWFTAAESARFRLPFVNLGLNPEAGSSYLLPHMIGYHQAAELVLLGDFFDAPSARKVGIVNDVYADKDLVEKCLGRRPFNWRLSPLQPCDCQSRC